MPGVPLGSHDDAACAAGPGGVARAACAPARRSGARGSARMTMTWRGDAALVPAACGAAANWRTRVAARRPGMAAGDRARDARGRGAGVVARALLT